MSFITRYGFNHRPFVESAHTSKKVSNLMVSNGIYDEIKIDESLDVINSIDKKIWSMDTVFDWRANNSLEAGNLASGNGMKIQKIRFKRRKVGDLNWEVMVDCPFSDDIENYDIEDFYIENQKNYEYSLVPVVQSFEGVGVISKITPEYFSLFLTGRNDDGNLVNYPLRFDLKTSEISPNFDRTYQKTLSSKYPAVLCGKSNYLTGNISVKLISPTTEVNGGKVNIQAENAYRESFESFIASGRPILIRNHSMYILGTISDPKKNPAFNEETAFGLYDFTMSFTEYNDAKNMEILKNNNLNYEVTSN